MTPQDHIKLNKAKCLSVSLSVKFKFIELLTQLKKNLTKEILAQIKFLVGEWVSYDGWWCKVISMSNPTFELSCG